MATKHGTMGDDVLIGYETSDDIYGLAGDDDIQGMGGDDWLVGGEGDDLIDGGMGMDIAMYYDGRAVTVDLAGGTAERGDELDSLTNVEGVWGSRFNDMVTGDGGANYAYGGAGHDTLKGMGGDDELRGGMGHDHIEGGTGKDFLVGNQGNDTLMGGSGDDRLQGGNDDDVVIGGTGKDLLVGGPGADKIKGGTFVMPGMPVDAPVAGGDGQFTNALGSTASYFASAEGVTIDISDTTTGVDATDDNDTINSDAAVLVLGDKAGGDAVDDTLYGIENLQGSMMDDMLTGRPDGSVLEGLMGDDTLIGGAAADTLRGGAGDDVLVAGDAAADTMNMLAGGPGADKIKGGDFDFDTEQFTNGTTGAGDMAMYGHSEAGVTIDLSKATPAAEVTNSDAPVLKLGESAGGDAVGDVLYGIEHLSGSDMADALTGDAGGNLLIGMGGDDTLKGGDGADTIRGGEGADMIEGGAGADVIDAGEGNDTIDVGADNPTLTVQMDDDDVITAGVSGGAGMDTLTYAEVNTGTVSATLAEANMIEVIIGSEDVANTIDAQAVEKYGVMITGGDEADGLTGGMKDDTIDGGDGDDTLNGREGADMLMGGDGNDTLNGDETDDTVGGADMLMGGDGNDTLNGLLGDDTLSGGMGNDALAGGGGDDVFVYMGGNDSISDFEISHRKTEMIDLRSLGLTSTELTQLLDEGEYAGNNLSVTLDLSDIEGKDLEGMITITGTGTNLVATHIDEDSFMI